MVALKIIYKKSIIFIFESNHAWKRLCHFGRSLKMVCLLRRRIAENTQI